MRLVFFFCTLFLTSIASTAYARGHHHHRHHGNHHHHHTAHGHTNSPPDLIELETDAGTVKVAAAVAEAMKGFINEVVALDDGLIGQVHCYAAHGHIRHSLHHTGNACDFAQTGWDRTRPVMYDIRELASKWGLRDGCSFKHRKDCGHIDVGRGHRGVVNVAGSNGVE